MGLLPLTSTHGGMKDVARDTKCLVFPVLKRLLGLWQKP